MIHIFVVGYPRSGNTWVARLLGDVLNCEVGGLNNDGSLASRKGPSDTYRVTQHHFRVNFDSPMVYKKFMNPKLLGQNKVIYVERDPRDVSISATSYWRRPSIINTLSLMMDGSFPMAFSPWSEYIERWNQNTRYISSFVRYEEMHESAINTLRRILEDCELTPVIPIPEAVDRNSFMALRMRILKAEPDAFKYGRDIQLHHLRRGHVADWQNFYNRRMGQFAHQIFWPLMQRMGYEKNADWYLKLPVEAPEPFTVK